MREFPSKFTPGNLAQFPQFKYDRVICYLREAVYEWFLNEKPADPPKKIVKPDTEAKGAPAVDVPLGSAPSSTAIMERKEIGPYESPFDLDSFQQRYTPPQFIKMIETIRGELKKLGWDTTLGYNNTSLWIYPPGQVPKSVPDWQ